MLLSTLKSNFVVRENVYSLAESILENHVLPDESGLQIAKITNSDISLDDYKGPQWQDVWFNE